VVLQVLQSLVELLGIQHDFHGWHCLLFNNNNYYYYYCNNNSTVDSC